LLTLPDLPRAIRAFFVLIDYIGTLPPAVRSPTVPKYTYNITDLTDFDSEPIEIVLEGEPREFAALLANKVLSNRPDLSCLGVCIAVYDEQGDPAAIVPLDKVQ
jgi:hypothetical protein